MIKIKQAVIVEGRYDKIHLSSIVDTLIIETDGFRIFKDKEKMSLIRALAKTRGIIILTDSDSAGFKIRSYISGCVGGDIKNVYIPDIKGKERRKEKGSAEGTLGVEGVPKSVILASFEAAGIIGVERPDDAQRITKLDLYEDGLYGRENSASLREQFLEKLSLPRRLSANAMPEILSTLLTFPEYKKIIGELQK